MAAVTLTTLNYVPYTDKYPSTYEYWGSALPGNNMPLKATYHITWSNGGGDYDLFWYPICDNVDVWTSAPYALEGSGPQRYPHYVITNMYYNVIKGTTPLRIYNNWNNVGLSTLFSTPNDAKSQSTSNIIASLGMALEIASPIVSSNLAIPALSGIIDSQVIGGCGFAQFQFPSTGHGFLTFTVQLKSVKQYGI